MLYRCSACKCGFDIGGVIPHGTSYLLCNGCARFLYTCYTCKHRTDCALKDYNQPDLFVMKTIQQENMILQTQVINPEVIERICGNRICESPVNCQSIHTCDKYEMEEYEE